MAVTKLYFKAFEIFFLTVLKIYLDRWVLSIKKIKTVCLYRLGLVKRLRFKNERCILCFLVLYVSKIGLLQNVQQFFLTLLFKVKLIHMEKSLKLYILSAFSQKNLKYSKKNDYFTFRLKRSKSCFWSILTSTSERMTRFLMFLKCFRMFLSKNNRKIVKNMNIF
jgi:hypothetical protein